MTVPAGVEINVSDTNLVTVKGPKGTLSEQISEKIKVEVAAGEVKLTPVDDDRLTNAQHGLARSLVNNMVHGVTEGYEKKLQMIGA